MAQMHLLKMLNAGAVLIYVDHNEWVPLGSQFCGLTYNADFIGLHPAPDGRNWGYVVVEAESLRLAWEAYKPSVEWRAPEAVNPGNVAPLAAKRPITTQAIVEVVDRCIADNLGVEPTRLVIDEEFPSNQLTRARVRSIHAERWVFAHKQPPTPGANPRS